MLEFLNGIDIFECLKRLYGEEVEGLDLPLYALPKMHGGLPYGPEGLAEGFRDKKRVIYSWVENALYYQYREYVPKGRVSIVLFTWVMAGGLGDYAAELSIARRIKKAFPEAELELVTLLAKSERRKIPPGEFTPLLLYYDNTEEIAIPDYILEKMGRADIVLQVPTFYPYWDSIEMQIKRKGHCPRILHLGEYGFVNSKWYHPETGNVCMGVHPLEKGLLFEEKVHSDLLPNTYFAYFITLRGASTYLHALLTAKKRDSHDLYLHVSHPLPLLKAIETECLKNYGLSSIIVFDETRQAERPIESEGKKLFLIPIHGLSPQGVQREIAKSQNFVGCRGDRSFSEVVSQGKFFFYDALDHALPFLRDLYDLAKHHLPFYFSLHEYLKALYDRKTPPRELGSLIGDLMLDPLLFTGMEKLLGILEKNFSFEEPLIHMLRMHLFYKEYPRLEKETKLYFEEWLQKELPLKDLLEFFCQILNSRPYGRSS